MEKIPKFVDMKMDKEDMGGVPTSITDNSSPIYPYGLSICLSDKELKKLDMEGEAEVGDMFHGHFLATVKSVSKNDTTDGTKTRVEMQITHLSAENEDEENEEAEGEMEEYKLGRFNPYK